MADKVFTPAAIGPRVLPFGSDPFDDDLGPRYPREPAPMPVWPPSDLPLPDSAYVPPPQPPSPDLDKALALLGESLGGILTVLESIVGFIPSAYSLGGRLVAARAAYATLIGHLPAAKP